MGSQTAATVTTGWLPLGEKHAEFSASVTQIVPDVISGAVVVLCEPYGMEGLSADDGLNALTTILVARGHPVVRFRPPDLGDASDVAASDSILATWFASIEAAIELARSLGSGRRVFLFGLRLGATLAGVVSASRTDVAGLVLWAPVNGRLFLREQRLIRSSATRSKHGPDNDSGSVEAAGFRMSAETISDVSSLDLLTINTAPAPRMLFIDRDDVPSARSLVDHFESLEPFEADSISCAHWPGYAGLRLDTPDEGTVPTPLFHSIAEWIETVTTVEVVPSEFATDNRPVDTLQLPTRATERVVSIKNPGEVSLHGIVTEPARDLSSSRLPIMVMLSTGGNPCSGAGRVHSELARNWAKKGFTSLRIDRRGVGISALREHVERKSGCDSMLSFDRIGPYSDEHLCDLIEIERFIQAEFDGRPYVLIGICSGGYASFHSVRTGVSPAAIVSINQMIFDPLEFASPSGTQTESPVFAMKARYQLTKTLKDPTSWVPILRGEVPIRPAIRRLVTYARLRTAANKSDPNQLADPMNVNHQMHQMADLGIKQVYLFDEAETGLAYLRFRAQATMNDLVQKRALHLSTVTDAGHTFGTSASRIWLGEAICRGLNDVGIAGSVAAKNNDKRADEL